MSVLKKIVIKDLRGSFKYHIFIGRNILYKLNDDFKKQIKNKNVFLLYDDFFNPINKVGNPIFELNKNISEVATSLKLFPVKSRDTNKNFKKLQNLIEKMLSYKIDRDSVIITFGGGVIGDIGGFAAAILLRGIKYIQIPTTLLAQVDSSVGGKTGINTKKGKNLIGTFSQPKLVLSELGLLKSLPKREMICGFAEVLKHAIIKDKDFFKWIEKRAEEIIFNKNMEIIKTTIIRSCKIKIFFVTKDEKERGDRAILNFGHTFAHGLEGASNFSKKINHGEAVLVGMYLATKLSEQRKICSVKTFNRLKNFYRKNNLPNNIKKYFLHNKLNKIIKYMINDKKNNDSKINLILLKKIGKTTKPGSIKIRPKNMSIILKKLIQF